jgi:hypothetical protein
LWVEEKPSKKSTKKIEAWRARALFIVFFLLVASSTYLPALKVKAVQSSEDAAKVYRSTWRYIPGNITLNNIKCSL